MFTSNSTLLSKDITTIITNSFGVIGRVFNQPLDQLIKSMFANNEVGFAYDPNDLTTLYQDAAVTVPVTAAEQPVGLMLDKSKGLVIGANIANPTTVIGSGIGGTEFKATTVSSTHAAGKWYEVSMQVSNFSGTIDVGFTGVSFPDTPISSKTISGNGIIRFKGRATDALVRVYTRSVNNADFLNISIKEIAGNHAYQATSSMRPLLAASPQRLDYDTADDKLITNLPAQLTGCTVIRAVPNVGTQILTNQTIPTPYNDNTDHCGLIVINRDLTATETAKITRLFNKAAGV